MGLAVLSLLFLLPWKVKQGQVIAKGIMLLPARTIVWLLLRGLNSVFSAAMIIIVYQSQVQVTCVSQSIRTSRAALARGVVLMRV